jgi:hypothetical protein
MKPADRVHPLRKGLALLFMGGFLFTATGCYHWRTITPEELRDIRPGDWKLRITEANKRPKIVRIVSYEYPHLLAEDFLGRRYSFDLSLARRIEIELKRYWLWAIPMTIGTLFCGLLTLFVIIGLTSISYED